MWGLLANIIGGLLGSKSAGGAAINSALNYMNSAKNQPKPEAKQM